MQLDSFDVIVIGAGHAGIEAAAAAARLGSRTALFSLSLDGVANMPCNPSIGGTAKSHLVREVDALGGWMGQAADATALQCRMLNLGKGPAVHSLRMQSDRRRYHAWMKARLEHTPNLYLKQGEITEICFDAAGAVTGVVTRLGARYGCRAVVAATGTYLGGRIFVGQASLSSGPDGQHAPQALTDCLRRRGLAMRRFKTGTPARVNRRSIDFGRLAPQPGDDTPEAFSFLAAAAPQNRVMCHIAFTNAETHRIILDNLHRSPLYSGDIQGVGPRYCPSIEDKVVRFADKDRHQIFVEPCGDDTDEMYLQGMSSSLPEDVQLAMYRSIEGFEKLEIMRPAYAIEYDCIDPLQLTPALGCKTVPGLYCAGQFNGTSGYEEAAAQGLIAGANAALYVQGRPAFTLSRADSYTGTLIDDLVTKGVSDPYRMMTSRSEYRLYLRQDNADERLTPLGRAVGLVDDARWARYSADHAAKTAALVRLQKTVITPAMAADRLPVPLPAAAPAAALLRRPDVRYADIAAIIGPDEGVGPRLAAALETQIKYEGYIQREAQQIEKLKRAEATAIPPDFDYAPLDRLRLEAREKLARVRPQNLGQAARIPGVSPADIAMLSLELAARRRAAGGMAAGQSDAASPLQAAPPALLQNDPAAHPSAAPAALPDDAAAPLQNDPAAPSNGAPPAQEKMAAAGHPDVGANKNRL